MGARFLVSEEKNARRCTKICGSMFAGKFDVTDPGSLRNGYRIQWRPSLFERQRHKPILVVKDISQSLVSGLRGQKFLSATCGGTWQEKQSEETAACNFLRQNRHDLYLMSRRAANASRYRRF